MKIDLHMHSTFSDGKLSPQELVDLTVSWDYDVISITDHDNIDAYLVAKNYAADKPIKIIPGVEMSTLHNGKDIHILGYYIDTNNTELLNMLGKITDSRENRAEKMLEELQKLGIGLSINDVKALTGESDVIGRPHIARAMVKAGICRSVNEAFYKYIGDDGPAYLPKPSITPEEAIKLIHKAKGVAILAHPFKSGDHTLIDKMIEAGIDGLETYYALHSPEQVKMCQDYALKYNLASTGGTDNHGTYEALRQYGHYSAPEKCYYDLLDRRTI